MAVSTQTSQSGQLPPGYYRDQQGRIFNQVGQQVDPATLRPISGGGTSAAAGPQPNPASPPPAAPAKPAAPQPQAGPDGDYDPVSPGIQRSPVGIHGRPGQEKWSPDDQYGLGMRQNTNQAGVQSNGDDDPWLIGAFEGGTYDPGVMREWVGRAAKGDAAADWLLRQVGLQPGMSPEEWAASRNLHTYQQDFSPGGRYYGGGQAQAKPVAVTGGVARDQGDQAPDWQRGSGPGPTDINVAAGEYDNLPYYGGLPSQGGGQRGGEGVSQGGGSRASRDSGPAAGATSKPSLYGNLPDTTPDPTGPLPYYDTPKTEAAPQAQKFVRSRYFGN